MNNNRSHPVYNIGLFRVLSKDDAECIECTKEKGESKVDNAQATA